MLHQLGYKVWEIPKLTILEKRRLVRGYILYQNPEDTQEEKRIQAEELIKKRKEHARAKRQDNSNG